MLDDNACTLHVSNSIMRICAVLVLREENRILQFSDVVVECACSYQLAFGSNFIGNLCCQIGNLHAVLEGSGCLF